ncbi:hypothetical protein [Streptomyces cavernicola]|uniref:Uncharacterized protein n=1 Tax=Streptomyces cavernicola TaxID=3043613 RepID=A0ABT6SCA0_9ACTN|nr:hypothetical protein [Streptomyces sp. B-S-A6]MDI3405822.1 hypothetical protein [Streptomyces sp. B-S-A6]
MSPAADAARMRVLGHVEELRETLPQPQFALLLRVLRSIAGQGGYGARLPAHDLDRAHFTPLVRNEMLRTWTMVGPTALADPACSRQLAAALDALLAGIDEESAALDGIAQASGVYDEGVSGGSSGSGGTASGGSATGGAGGA